MYELKLVNTTGCINASTRDEVIEVTVFAAPKQVQITVAQNYGNQEVAFAANATNEATGWNWKWEFGDGSTKDTRLFDKTTTSEGLKGKYLLTVSTSKGCQVSIDKSFELDFTPEGFCLGSPTRFVNHSMAGKVAWDFGDGKGKSTQTTPQYIYQAPGTYIVTLTIVDGEASYSLQKRVNIFPVIEVLTNKAYQEGFDQGAGQWISEGTTGEASQLAYKTSWQCKVPTDTIIKNTQGKAWLTDIGDVFRVKYFNNEKSYVESPCFDIGKLDKPMLSLRYWLGTDVGADGVVLLFTVDDGKRWQRLGKKEVGLRWYNTDRILASPGEDANKEKEGWSGSSQGWQLGVYSLDEVLIAMNTQNVSRQIVRFRIVFASNGDNPANTTLGGFAFDNVQLSSRNRRVLLEYFTNQNIANAEALSLQTKRFPNTGRNNEIISIHHHTYFPARDDINEQNSKDVSARVLHYGIGKVPVGIMDGLQSKEKDWDENLFYNRTLIPSPFMIDASQTSLQGTQLKASIKVQAVSPFDRAVVIQVVVLDTLVESEGKTFYHIVRKMLPTAAGTYRNTPWTASEQQTLEVAWDIGNLDPQKLKLVVFIEDYLDRTIHQAAVAALQNLRPTGGNGGGQVTAMAPNPHPTKGIEVFPNPSIKQITVRLPQTSNTIHWKIVGLAGKVIKTGQWQRRAPRVIKVHDLAQGVYWLQVTLGDRVYYQKLEKK